MTLVGALVEDPTKTKSTTFSLNVIDPCLSTNKELVANEKVIQRIQEEVDVLNEKFGNWEKIKRFELTEDAWTIDGGQLTPTLKLKRKIVMEKYKDLYSKIYGKS